MSSYEEKICESIEYIVQKAISRAEYDRTIQATIIRCEDEATGKYKVKYQDSSFYAYSNSANTSYIPDSLVYVLIPKNDMNSLKTIVGSVKKLGTGYVPVVKETDEINYEIIGNNCIGSSSTFSLCSYKGEQRKILYQKDGNNNLITVDEKGLTNYFKQVAAIMCAGVFKTALNSEQQYAGNYGIHYELAFKDNATGEIVIRDYILDIDNMEGNPYKQSKEERQYDIFELDGMNFQYINQIEIFSYGFPNYDESKSDDIFISALEISGVKFVDPEELNSYFLTILTPKGTYFDSTHLKLDTKVLKTELRVERSLISEDLITYYWFVENASVSIGHEKYNRYGGQGWACLNNFKETPPEDENDSPIIEWLPGQSLIEITKQQNPAKNTKYKCVVEYNNMITSKEVSITNLDSEFNISIESNQGTQFFYDNGNPTLTCLINNEEQLENYEYIWVEIDNQNNYNRLVKNDEINTQYHTLLDAYNNLMAEIESGNKMLAANQELINDYEAQLKEFNVIQRADKNKIYNIKINKIVNFKTFKCSVYKEGLYIGTADIILTNSLDEKENYTLVINNGTQVFKYTEGGVAPTHKSLPMPMVLQPLSFTLYDKTGKIVDYNAIDGKEVKWTVPTVDTLLSTPFGYEADYATDTTETFTNLLDFNYTLVNRYSLDKVNNNIELSVKYKDMIFTEKTNFTFTKEGEPGTNGTEYICQILPNTSEDLDDYPMLINGVLNFTPNDSENGIQGVQWFKVQLWQNGDPLLGDNGLIASDEEKGVKVKWSVLKNKYKTSFYDNSFITVVEDVNGNPVFSYNGYYMTSDPANIIKCTVTYNGVEYYATLPLICASTSNTNIKSIKLKKNTGFRFVLYDASGTEPQYSDIPFEIETLEEINGYLEDVSKIKTGDYAVTYQWNILGDIYNVDNKKYEPSIFLREYDSSFITLEHNQKMFKPYDTYTNHCLTNGLECIVKRNNIELARIHIPIHFLLNRYGMPALNQWDGNSVSIDEDGGIILAPQAGAGHKDEKTNTFTGVLMGSVKESDKSTIETGLFGYAKGERTIFLNAETGTATFGAATGAQIIIDPSTGKAEIKSKQYVNGKGGMLIDLSTPSIQYGNGNFSVDENGYLVAKDANIEGHIDAITGTIAGFNFDQTNGFNTTITYKYWYSDVDYQRIESYLYGDKEYYLVPFYRSIYDINGDGKIDHDDLDLIEYIINNGDGRNHNVNVTTEFSINPTDPFNLISYAVYRPNYQYMMEKTLGRIGSGESFLNNISANYLKLTTVFDPDGTGTWGWNWYDMFDSREPGIALDPYKQEIRLVDAYTDNVLLIRFGEDGRPEIFPGTLDPEGGYASNGTLVVPDSNVEAVEFIASGGRCMHGTNKAHYYTVNWGSSLTFYVDGTNVGSLSDERLKTEIKEIEEEKILQAIQELKIKQFKLINRNGKISIGVIAQELIAIFTQYNIDINKYDLINLEQYNVNDETLYYVVNYEQLLILKTLCLEQQYNDLLKRVEKLETLIK